jgi:hypothetical protein
MYEIERNSQRCVRARDPGAPAPGSFFAAVFLVLLNHETQKAA